MIAVKFRPIYGKPPLCFFLQNMCIQTHDVAVAMFSILCRVAGYLIKVDGQRSGFVLSCIKGLYDW